MWYYCRSTRKLSLTEAGASFYESAKDVVEAAEQGRIRVNQLRDELAGNLRIARPQNWVLIIFYPRYRLGWRPMMT